MMYTMYSGIYSIYMYGTSYKIGVPTKRMTMEFAIGSK